MAIANTVNDNIIINVAIIGNHAAAAAIKIATAAANTARTICRCTPILSDNAANGNISRQSAISCSAVLSTATISLAPIRAAKITKTPLSLTNTCGIAPQHADNVASRILRRSQGVGASTCPDPPLPRLQCCWLTIPIVTYGRWRDNSTYRASSRTGSTPGT